MSDVTDALDALASGAMTLEQAAALFARRTWPQPPKLTGTLADEAFPPDPPGSFAEVSAAFSAGQITAAQYQVLAEAAARAMGGGRHWPSADQQLTP